jgi:flagellar M-ring protein FliF
VELDPSVRERTEEHYEPSKTALRSEQKVEERSNTEGSSVAGVPGALSNLPDSPEANAESEGGNSARVSWTRNWEVDKVVEKTSAPPGKVTRLSVAVLVDGVQRNVNGQPVWQPREKAELDRFAELIKGAVGFDAARGDVLQIDTAEFSHPAELAPGPDLKEAARRARWIYIGVGAAALLLLIATVVLVRRRKSQAPIEVPSDVLALEAGPDTIALEGKAIPALPRPMSREEANVIRGEAIDLAARDPATAAVILREWLNSSSASPQEPAHF